MYIRHGVLLTTLYKKSTATLFINVFKQIKYLYDKVKGSLSVCVSACLYLNISLTAETIWFFFTEKPNIGPGMNYDYFWRRFPSS